MDRPRLAVVIPACNEAATIGAVVAGALRHATVLVVDDCSQDETSERAEAAGAIVVHNRQRLGYDGSLNRGIAAALQLGFAYLVTMDADGEHSPEFLAQFSSALVEQNIPMVLGVRPRKQRFSEILMGLYVRARYGPRDILCGMKGYRGELVRKYGGSDRSGSLGTELVLKSISDGTKFLEISIDGVRRSDRPRFGSRWQANMIILRTLWRLLRA